MSDLTDLQDYRDEIGAACHQARHLLMMARKWAPSHEIWDETTEFIDAVWSLVEEHLGVLKSRISNLEDDLPGEDMRREHGTYYTTNGRRAA